MSEFGTRYGSWAVVAGAKFWRDQSIAVKIKANGIFLRFKLCAHQSSVKGVRLFPNVVVGFKLLPYSNVQGWDFPVQNLFFPSKMG